MGWIEDTHGAVLMVRQACGRKLWTLPGGKVLPTEAIEKGLRREIHEETSGTVAFATQIAFFDRPEKRNVTFLYRVMLKAGRPMKPNKREIAAVEYRTSLPRDASPSLRHFWNLLRHGRG